MLLFKSSSTKVSDPSEVPWFVGKLVFVENQAGVLVLDNLVDQILAKD